MNYIKEFFQNYGFTIVYTVLTAVASFIGLKIKAIYQNKVNEGIKKDVVETCVKAVEQLYSDMNGSKKLEKAKESIVAMLNDKDINVSEIELDMLIESVVAEFNFLDLSIKSTTEENKETIVEDAMG